MILRSDNAGFYVLRKTVLVALMILYAIWLSDWRIGPGALVVEQKHWVGPRFFAASGFKGSVLALHF